jgi:hypothetical protein
MRHMALLPGLLTCATLWVSACSGGSDPSRASSVTAPATPSGRPDEGQSFLDLPVHRRPTISTLEGRLTSTPCTLPDVTVPAEGRLASLRFRYRDPDGNVRGGRVEVTEQFSGQAPELATAPVPSPGVVKITGTTSGTIEVGPVCLRFGPYSAVTESVVLVDRAGLRSNRLTRRFPRPPGFPEHRQAGGETSTLGTVGFGAALPGGAPPS